MYIYNFNKVAYIYLRQKAVITLNQDNKIDEVNWYKYLFEKATHTNNKILELLLFIELLINFKLTL